MSFRLKTILGISLIEILVLTILVFSSLQHLRSSNEQELFTRARVTAQLLATMTSDAVISSDLATLDSLIQQTMKNDGLVYARILNRSGIAIAEDGDAAALAAPFKADEDAVDVEDQRIDFAAPIVVGGERFGRIEIGLSTHLLDEIVTAATARMLIIVAIEIIFVALFGFLLGSVLTRQLAHLRSSAKRVAAGEFGHQMEVSGKDELADTAKSFNTMSKALADYAHEAELARERAEAGQAYAETLLNDAMNSVSQSIFIVDADGKLEFVNKAVFNMYPVAPKAFTPGMRFDAFLEKIARGIYLDAEQIDETFIADRIERLAKKEERQTWQSKWSDDTVILHAQRPMSNGGVVLVDTDISDFYMALEKNQRLELELMQTHKLESLGTLASGVAHEINTPTQFIGDNMRFLSSSFEDIAALVTALENRSDLNIQTELQEADWDFLKEEIPSALKEASSGIESIGNIVRSIKEFSHPDDGEIQDYDIKTLVETAVTVSRSQWRHNAELTVACKTDDTIVPCYPGDLSQVLINLIVNAADAIAERKTDGNPQSGHVLVTIDRSPDSLLIEVADNGGGIKPEMLHRIFDMFFTTKAPGKGTGQGLAISKSIVEGKHNGSLRVSSTLGQGTVFTITLPVEPALVHGEKEEDAA